MSRNNLKVKNGSTKRKSALSPKNRDKQNLCHYVKFGKNDSWEIKILPSKSQEDYQISGRNL